MRVNVGGTVDDDDVEEGPAPATSGVGGVGRVATELSI